MADDALLIASFVAFKFFFA